MPSLSARREIGSTPIDSLKLAQGENFWTEIEPSGAWTTAALLAVALALTHCRQTGEVAEWLKAAVC